MNLDSDDAVTTAATVQRGNISAVEVVTAALARIEARDRELNCFTVLTAEKPPDAKQIDRAVELGKTQVPRWCPFAVKKTYLTLLD